MIVDDLNLGWRDHINTFMRFQTAVKILVQGKDKFEARMDEATSALVGLFPEDFPARIRRRAEYVLNARDVVRKVHPSNHVSFEFRRLTPKTRKELAENIVSLYEACIFDMSKAERDIVYPADIGENVSFGSSRPHGRCLRS